MPRDSKLPVATSKQINEQHRLAIQCAESAIEHAILCGQLLVEKKASLAHGEFQSWVDKNCEFAYRTAARYMKAAQSSEALNLSSLRQIFPSEKPAQKTNNSATKPALESVQKCQPCHFSEKTATEKAPFSPPAETRYEPPKPTGTQVLVPTPEPKLIEVTPAPDFDFAGYEPQDDDAYKQSVENVMMADDRLGAMRSELEQAHREIQALKSSRDHYQSQAGEAVRLVKSRDREIEKLKRELAKAKGETLGGGTERLHS